MLSNIINCFCFELFHFELHLQGYQMAAQSSLVGEQVMGCVGWQVMPYILVLLQGCNSG